jgi:hypothetical protein
MRSMCPASRLVSVPFYFYRDKFEVSYWTDSRCLFLEWNEEVEEIFAISGA